MLQPPVGFNTVRACLFTFFVTLYIGYRDNVSGVWLATCVRCGASMLPVNLNDQLIALCCRYVNHSSAAAAAAVLLPERSVHTPA